MANSLVPVLDLIGIFYLCLDPSVKSLNLLFHFPSTDHDPAPSSSFPLKRRERCTQNEPKSSSSHVQYEINRTSADERALIVSYARADIAPKAHYRPPVYSKLSATWGAVAVSLPLHGCAEGYGTRLSSTLCSHCECVCLNIPAAGKPLLFFWQMIKSHGFHFHRHDR